MAQNSIEDVFAAVASGSAAQGVVPFENSSNGSVVFTLDLFAGGRYADVLVSGEIYLPVHHCLLGRVGKTATASTSATTITSPSQSKGNSDLPLRNDPSGGISPSRSGAVTPTQTTPSPRQPRAKPLHDITHIKKLYSHPQAWGQCNLFLSTYLKHAERQDVSSTSKAAELVAESSSSSSGGGSVAAISSKIAAEVNGLTVLAEGIEDAEGNSTRFFVLRRGGEQDGLTVPNESEGDGVDGRWKSLVSFTLNHGEPGSLADCLEVFRRGGLNLTSINTRPSGEAAWHYIFFVEFMGRKLGEGGAVKEALEQLTAVASSWRWLGSWESALED